MDQNAQLAVVLGSFDVATAISSQTKERAQLYHMEMRVRTDWESVLNGLEKPEGSASSARLDPSITKTMRAVTYAIGWTNSLNEDITTVSSRQRTRASCFAKAATILAVCGSAGNHAIGCTCVKAVGR